MAKKQKAKDKSDLKDESIEIETHMMWRLFRRGLRFINRRKFRDSDAAEKIKDLEEALLRSRAELDNAFKRNTADIEKAHKYGVERLLQ